MFRLQDRRGNDFLLAPTHEELFTLLVKDLYSSYKDLPLVIYQIQTKYRDEARPRAGLLRGREFVMKDSYSFDIDDAGLEKSYQRHRDAYIATFERLGLPFVIVSAMSGAMGGSASEEFLAPIEAGEDTYVRCSQCDYAANVEAVRVPIPPDQPFDDVPAAAVLDTPETPTIATLVDLLNARQDLRRPDREWAASDTLEERHRVAARAGRVTSSRWRSACRATVTIDEKRLEAQVLPAEVEPFTDADFAARPELVKGYIGPDALGTAFAVGHPLPRRSPDRHRHTVGHRARTPQATTPPTSSPGATSCQTACSTSPTCGRAMPARPAARRSRSPEASRWATSSSSGGCTPRRSGCG